MSRRRPFGKAILGCVCRPDETSLSLIRTCGEQPWFFRNFRVMGLAAVVPPWLANFQSRRGFQHRRRFADAEIGWRRRYRKNGPSGSEAHNDSPCFPSSRKMGLIEVHGLYYSACGSNLIGCHYREAPRGCSKLSARPSLSNVSRECRPPHGTSGKIPEVEVRFAPAEFTTMT
jgi:hypothetical protein